MYAATNTTNRDATRDHGKVGTTFCENIVPEFHGHHSKFRNPIRTQMTWDRSQTSTSNQ